MPHRKKTACPVFLRTGSSVADPAGRAAAYWEDNGLPPEREIKRPAAAILPKRRVRSIHRHWPRLPFGKRDCFPGRKASLGQVPACALLPNPAGEALCRCRAPGSQGGRAAVIVRFGQLQADINDTDNPFAVASQESESGGLYPVPYACRTRFR